MPRGLVMATVQPEADLALLGSETAAIRPAIPVERKRIAARRQAVVYSIVLRTCAGVDVVVAPATKTSLAFRDSELKILVDRFAATDGLSRSAAIVCLVTRIWPSISDLLRTHRPTSGRCDRCDCLWRAGGALDDGAGESRMIRVLLADAVERAAA